MNLNQITIPSRDLHVCVPFYQKLGLTLIVDALPRYAHFTCPKGDTTFSIHLVEETSEGEGIYVYFEHEKLDEMVRHLISGNISFNEMPSDKSWLWREARFKDPDGKSFYIKQGRTASTHPGEYNRAMFFSRN